MSSNYENLQNSIIKLLEQFINAYNDKYNFEVFNYDCIEIYAFDKKDNKKRICILKVGISEDNEQIYIPNVFVPMDLRYFGIGKKMIYLIYIIGLEFGYDVFVVDLVESFREKLIKRGAETCDIYDILQITENTNLLNPV